MTTHSPIRVLDGALVDQIAAGEVVERPASVVKELLENALDAGARTIRVEVDGGGLERILVADDGVGLSGQDIRLAAVRHATSKIRTLDDLSQVRSFGFRGEALPSIASVSRFTLTARTADDDEGACVQIDGGNEPSIRPAGGPVGTIVEVRDLFFNVPARQKFLKAEATENAHVAETCLRAALQDPGLRLTLRRGGRAVREYLPTPDIATRVRAAFGDEPLELLEGEREAIRITAVLGPPERARRGAKSLHLFVNRRALRDRALARAVTFAYGSVLPPGHYPTGAVYIDLDPTRIDVNVHPQKAEVRFSGGRRVYDTVTRVLASKLGTTAWGSQRRAAVPASADETTLRRDPAFWETRLGASVGSAPKGGVAERDPWPTTEAPPISGATETLPRQEALDGPRGRFGALRVLAQVRRMILVCEGEDGIYFVDQHAADERLRFAQLKRAYDAREVKTQRLLFPERVELSLTDVAVIEEHQTAIGDVGFDTVAVGPSTVAVHAIPSLLHRASPERLLRDLVTELTHGGDRAFGDAIDMALATMACHGAIRAGDVVSVSEGQTLLERLDAVDDFAGHCPHGRPIVMSVPFGDIERRLGR